MKLSALLFILSNGAAIAQSELRVPASTAYLAPDPNGAKVSKDTGISAWTKQGTSVLWFGEFKSAGKVQASVALRLPKGKSLKLRLNLDDQKHEVTAHGGDGEVRATLGEFSIPRTGFAKFELQILDHASPSAGVIAALLLDGPPAKDAHFNLDARRNAASVHLNYPTPADAPIAGFYNEVIAVEDPVATYYMACGFSRGYFGMQVNSEKERRIIFSVWDAASGQTAKDRGTVAPEHQTRLLAKGEGVEAGVFGNEGTGGHSHLVYNWKTGSTQRFYVMAKPEGADTVYSGWWYHPELKKWRLLASFRAPQDGKYLRGLYSFSENFNGNNGHLLRKALYGPQWIRLVDGNWIELTHAGFSHDGTGKENRTDRFMGLDNGRFFLSHGGFIPGTTPYGEKFTRPGGGAPPADVPASAVR